MSRVLVVDDDPQLLSTLRINLTAHGYTVVAAPDGATALRAAATTPHPDVVVRDVGRPDMPGASGLSGLSIQMWSARPVQVRSRWWWWGRRSRGRRG